MDAFGRKTRPLKKAATSDARRIVVLHETHETPEYVAYRLARAGGINRFGEPNYRAVWGWNRLAWIGGKFAERDPSTGSLLREVVELREEPKYPAVNRWHVERWLPPEAYGSPRQWYSQTVERENGVSIPALGPYPSRGEYEHCVTLEGPRGEFLQLTSTVVEHIARAIECSRVAPRSALRAGAARRPSLRTVGLRRPRRRRPRIPQATLCNRAVAAVFRPRGLDQDSAINAAPRQFNGKARPLKRAITGSRV